MSSDKTIPDPSPTTFRPLLSKLVQEPEFFTPDDLRQCLRHIFATSPNNNAQSVIPDAQVAAFLTGLHINRLERRPEFLAAAAALLREYAHSVEVEAGKEGSSAILDIVGTGGDGYNLFNVSTASAIVAAGCGARVIKHGSRASTSSSGSADLLQALGCSFSAGAIPKIANRPFTFILAPHYHPTLALLAPIRKMLPFRTMFNITGPLINPAKPEAMLLGVAEPGIGAAFARSLRQGGVKHAWVVCGLERLDEISCAGPTKVWEVHDGQGGLHGDDVIERTITPEDFGLKRHPLHSVAGGTPDENAQTFERLVKRSPGDGGIPQDLEAIADFVCLNTGALLFIGGHAKDGKDGARMARESIESGKAWKAFVDFREQTQA